MARMRRKFADRNEGIMNPRLRESNYTAGRETWRPGFEQTGNGTMRMNIPKRRQENIPYSAGRMRPGDLYAKKLWEAQHAPESLENTYPLYNMFKDQAGIVNSGMNMPREWQMAELSGKQQDWMGSGYGTPDFYSNFNDYFDAVTAQEDKGFLGVFGGQDPATKQEVIDYLGESYVDDQGRPKTLPWSVTT